jgi:hypothetical protein
MQRFSRCNMLVSSFESGFRKERSQNAGDTLWLADIVGRQMAEAAQFDAPGIGQDSGNGIQRQRQIGRTSIASQQKRFSACQPEGLDGAAISAARRISKCTDRTSTPRETFPLLSLAPARIASRINNSRMKRGILIVETSSVPLMQETIAVAKSPRANSRS